MTFAQIKADVFRRLRESSSAPVFWTEADVEAAINEAYMELSDQAEWNETFQTVDLLSSRPWYDARTYLSEKILTVGRAFNVTTNRWLNPTVPRDLDPYDARWERVTGQPQRIMVRGLFWFGYWPQVTSQIGSIQQFYTELPDALEDDTDEPGFPDTLHDALVEGALFELFSQDAEPALAAAAWEAFLSYERALQGWVNDRLSVPQMRTYGSH
jgi:hypothetical protein